MGSLFRSEEMTLAQLFVQNDSAFHCLSELGELGLVQFRDLNQDVNAFNRHYVGDIRQLEDMERCLRFMEGEIDKSKITIVDNGRDPDAPSPNAVLDLYTQFNKLEAEIREINSNQERLNRNFLELTELRHILRQTANFFEEAEQAYVGPESRLGDRQALLSEDAQIRSSPLSFVAGVINRQRMPTFERLLWRSCRGNAFLRYKEIDAELKDPTTGDTMNKCVFLIFFQGNQLRARVKKICDGFQATQYPCPGTAAERREMAMGVATRIEDLSTVLSQTLDHRFRVLQAIAKSIRDWSIKVKKIKAIYHTLNMLNVDVTQKCLIGECWCPVADLDEIQYALRRGHDRSGSSVMPILNVLPTAMKPPTYNKVNKFTSGFQTIIDAYGVATYREVNPAPFSIITFPFLFAVMFGDMGHGLLMFLFALFLVIKEKKLGGSKNGEIFGTFFGGRYIILLMGAFSMYTGLVYNDCFSKSFNIFGSSWNTSSVPITHATPDTVSLSLDRDFHRHNPYPFGLDPIWQVATNKLTFTNSYKMKMSITMGVTQMMFGVILSLFNHLYFKRRINIWASFVPEVLFLGGIFGYLVFMIFFKWIAVDSSFRAATGGAPSLLIMLINMFLAFGSKIEDPMKFYDGQGVVQSALVVIAVIAVPWMLFTKPLVLYWRNRGSREFSIGDIFVHQAIHTIEFCLGCISNTASYLRLWALSLAHAELSEVMWNMGMRIAMKKADGIGSVFLFIIFAVWAAETIAILLIMEGLSAFLHALRLHWVEFNNKFYVGEGYMFQPFSFVKILDSSSD